MRGWAGIVAKALGAELAVMFIVGPLGFAMRGRPGLAWATSGAAVWCLVFVLCALWLRRSVLVWGVAGGLICGGAWAFGYEVVEWLMLWTYGRFDFRWASVFGAFGGVGAGLIAGAAHEVVPDPSFRRVVRLGGWAAAATWGALAAGAAPYWTAGIGTPSVAWFWSACGLACGLAALPVGWRVGRLLSPAVVFFEELGPYLAAMIRPLVAFGAGFATLTIVFAGLYGTSWRLESGRSFKGLPSTPSIWDFAEYSLMTATNASTQITPTSAITRLLTGVEVVLGMGWLIVVFGALSVHLAPRLEEIAARMHARSAGGDAAPRSPRSR